jgi:hypothetical protein
MEALSEETRNIIEQLTCHVCYETKSLVMCCAEGHPLCIDCKSQMSNCGICRQSFLAICPPCRPVNALFDALHLLPPAPPPPSAAPPPAAPLQLSRLRNPSGEVRDVAGQLRRLFKRLEIINQKILDSQLLDQQNSWFLKRDVLYSKISDAEVIFIERNGRPYRGRRGVMGGT